jgi:hypothetical protein
LTETEFHKQQAVDLFNAVWTFMEKADRSVEDDDAMIHAAHASRHHWAQVGEAANLARGEWQVSRVYCVLGRGEPALYHAGRCLAICEQHGIGDWDLAFAYESLARAHAVAGNVADSCDNLDRAREAGEHIADPQDRTLLLDDLATIRH